MLAYYLKVATRSAKRNKLNVGLSIVGLTVGLASSLLIGLYVYDELNYDTWIPEYEGVYRANSISSERRANGAPSELGQWLRQDYPQITAVVRFFVDQTAVSSVRDGETIEFNERITWADASAFEVFPLPAIYGNLETALEQPSSVVLDVETSEKYFGQSNPIGETLLFGGVNPMRVTAVIEDLPSNTHLDIGLLASSNTLFSPAAVQDQNPIQGYYGSKLWSTQTYLRLPSYESVDLIAEDMDSMLDRHLPVETGRTNAEIYDIELLPIADVHLSGGDASVRRENIKTVYTVGAIALLILLTASINYINLMTARGSKRAPEIAIRKTVGAERSALVAQFMTESVAYVVISSVFAVLLAYLLLPVFNGFLLREMNFVPLSNLIFLLTGLIILCTIIVMAGFYPAIVLSKYSALSLFRTNKIPSHRFRIREFLSVIQFSILTGLGISAYVIHQQAQFSVSESLRDLDDTIVIVRGSCSQSLKQQFLSLPGVEAAACVAQIPQYGLGFGVTIASQEAELNERIGVRYAPVDFGFFDIMDFQLLAGRGFSEERAGDIAPENNEWNIPQAIVVNESLIRAIGFDSADQAVGTLIEWAHLFKFPGVFTPQHDGEIVGVLEDFQIGSVTQAIPNVVFYVQHDPTMTRQMVLRISSENLPETLENIDSKWDEAGDPGPITRHFLDQGIKNMYQSIARQSQLLSIYATIAILIAVLGLFGLAAFVTEKRTKEIGIRKVLGGTRFDIVKLLLMQFSIPVLASNVIAWPVAFYYLTLWLRGFQSHIELHWWVFILAGAITLLIAWMTVFSHAFMVASKNPVKALRYE